MLTTDVLRSDPKLRRKLENLWARLTKRSAFVLGHSIDQIKQLGFFRAKVVVDSQWYFFTDEALANLRECIAAIHEKLGTTVSRAAIQAVLIEEIERSFSATLKRQTKPSAFAALQGVFQRLAEKQRAHLFIFPVHGLEMTRDNPVAFGAVTLFVLDEATKVEIERATSRTDSDFFAKVAAPFIDRYFFDKVCLKCAVFGELGKASELAEHKAGQVIAALRLFLCAILPDDMHRNKIKVSLTRDSIESREHYFSYSRDDHTISLGSGAGRWTYQELPLTPDRVADLKQHLYLDDLVALMDDPAPTEFAGTILTMIYWIGEAQHDYSAESAFLKYWTVIETLFATNKQDVTAAVTVGPVVLCAAVGYRFTPLKTLRDQKRLLAKLYDLRSRITHRGLVRCVQPSALSGICRAATCVILGALKLRQSQVKDMAHFQRGLEEWREKLKGELDAAGP